MNGNVLGRAYPLWESFTEETVVLYKLGKQMSNLQQQVEYFDSGGILAEDVFQCVSSILLNVKTLIFDFPTQSPSLISQGDEITSPHLEIGDPLEASSFKLLVRVRFGFHTFYDRNVMFFLFGIDIGNLIHPAQFLLDL